MKTLKPPKTRSPLIYPAAVLSAASLAWTTWSLVDLLGAGPIGLTVAAGADIIWGSVILAEARRLRINNKTWIVPVLGLAAVLAVAALLVWHGINQNIPAMAVAGPLLPLGAKAVWILALADMRDPAELTDDELAKLADIDRGMRYEEAKHARVMRRRAMDGELLMNEVSTDFDLELLRQDKANELRRRRPLELTTGEANARTSEHAAPEGEGITRLSEGSVRTSEAETAATFGGEILRREDANTAAHAASHSEAFGFAAVLQGEAKRDVTRTRKANTARPIQAKTSPTRKAKANNRKAALDDYRRSVANGSPLSGAELGRRYGHSDRWGQQLIAEAKNN